MFPTQFKFNLTPKILNVPIEVSQTPIRKLSGLSQLLTISSSSFFYNTTINQLTARFGVFQPPIRHLHRMRVVGGWVGGRKSILVLTV
jgi:hypothetical protein